MKNLYAAGIVGFLQFTAFASYAQVEPPLNQQLNVKPRLFSNLPEKFECNLAELEKLFTLSTTEKCTLKLNQVFQLDGLLSEKIKRSERLTSINVRLYNYEGALLNISRITGVEGASYTGRIININSGDLLQLKKEKEKYFFVKQEQKFFMVE